LNAYGGIIDEGNFIGEATQNQKVEMRRFGVLDKAELLYTGLKQRMQSRYMQKGGRLPGMLFVMSSKRTVNDFVERRLREVRQRGESTVFVREYSQWEVNPENYGTKRFWIVVGNDQLRSRILGPDEDPNQFRSLSGVQVVPIPEEFRPSFTKDFDAAVRDIAGMATIAISPFITRQDKIEDAVDHTYSHPFSVYEWEAGTLGHFEWERIVRIGENGERRPICCPKAPRYAHIDGSLRMDCTGIAVGHVHGWKDVERDDHAGSKFTEQSPIIKMDFVLRITPPVGQDIALADVRGLIYNLSEHGVSVVHVSMDSFQSAESLQQFILKGYKAEVISVDRGNIPYELLKAALYEDRLIIYDYKPLTDELRRLEYDRRKGKVDHPKGSSKDVSDAVAGVMYCLSISRQASMSGLSPEVTAPSLGISEFPEGDPTVVQGPLGQQTLTEDWDSDFKGDSEMGNGIIVAPPWLMGSKPTVPTFPLQRDIRRRN
jgi:hypothetical protein